ncbi:hypothetical protein DFH11DRAFT_799887 [Phellopilus nigrolimitatus]|nr:hypothetical protein DFH11DRAFT_799887 [Phellopilus nigrolimitatus]
METFDGRLHSFDKPKSKSSSKSATRAWPHPESFVPNPKSLAEAGFFHKPAKDDADNVQCFICKKELGGWDEEDNPFEIHVRKCPKCPWAVARCSLEFDVDSDGNFSLKDSARLPSNKVLEKARLDTFGGKQKWWPHDSVKNHGATSKKMAKAGFVYTPQAPGDDTATCFYCDLSLSGWDVEDDPVEEHHKREARSGMACHFFQAEVQSTSQKKQKTKQASKKQRATKQPAPPTDESEAEHVPDGVSDTMAKKSKQKASAAPASSATTSSRKKSTKPPFVEVEVEESEDLEEEDIPELKVKPAPRKSTKKPAPGKMRSVPAGKGKQPMAALSEEDEGGDNRIKEAATRPAHPQSRAGKEKGKEKENDKENDKGMDKDVDKPPSNVDGKVAKRFEDFSVDVNETEEKRIGRSKGKESSTKGRLRSKSKPRSTNADADMPAKPPLSKSLSQSKPLLRAASRARASEIVEVGDKEQPEIELEEQPTDKPRRQTRTMKTVTESDADEPPVAAGKTAIRVAVPAPTSKPPSVISDKSTSSKATNGREEALLKKTATKKPPRRKGKGKGKESSQSPESSQHVEQDERDVADVLHDAPAPVEDQDADNDASKGEQMDIDNAVSPETQVEPVDMKEQASVPADVDMAAEVEAEVSKFPAPKSPSDFKAAAPAKNVKALKSKPKSKPKPAIRSEDIEIGTDNSLAHLRSRSQALASPSSHPDSSMNTKSKAFIPTAKSQKPKTKPIASIPEYEESGGREESVQQFMDVDINATTGFTKTEIASAQPAASALQPAAEIRFRTPSKSPQPSPQQPATPEAHAHWKSAARPASPSATADADTATFQADLLAASPAHDASALSLFLPPLASTPLEHTARLTDAERTLTVEQWIRHEMERQYEQLRVDGERRIEAFKTMAAEVRMRIEAL